MRASQPPEAPPEAKELAQNTLIAVLFGIMYGGGKQYLVDRVAGGNRNLPMMHWKCLPHIWSLVRHRTDWCRYTNGATGPAVEVARGSICSRHSDEPLAWAAESIDQVAAWDDAAQMRHAHMANGDTQAVLSELVTVTAGAA